MVPFLLLMPEGLGDFSVILTGRIRGDETQKSVLLPLHPTPSTPIYYRVSL